jgi:hypothetical protein
MTSDRKKPGVAFWATVVVVVVLSSYVLRIANAWGMSRGTSDLFGNLVKIVYGPYGCEIFGLAILGGSVLLGVFSIMQRLGLAPVREADRGWWFIGVLAAVVLAFFGSVIAVLAWPRH